MDAGARCARHGDRRTQHPMDRGWAPRGGHGHRPHRAGPAVRVQFASSGRIERGVVTRTTLPSGAWDSWSASRRVCLPTVEVSSSRRSTWRYCICQSSQPLRPRWPLQRFWQYRARSFTLRWAMLIGRWCSTSPAHLSLFRSLAPASLYELAPAVSRRFMVRFSPYWERPFSY